MSSKKGFTSGSASASNTGKNVVEAVNPTVEQLGYSLSDVKLDSVPDGEWEVYTKKSKGRGVGSTANRWGPQRQAAPGNAGRGNRNTTGSAWPVAPVGRPTGRGTGRQQPLNNYRAPTAVQAPLKNGCNWASVASSGSAKGPSYSVNNGSDPHVDIADVKSEDDDDDALDDSDDDLASDEFDSDVSQKSHETRKTNRWFKKFFESLDGLTQEEINEPGRQWHCPACQGGPGAIDWFRGLQPLMTHAKTKGSKRVKLHREFADLLDEELARRGTSAYPSGEAFGKWKGLTQKTTDYAIVWPPMVVVMNTQLEQDEKDKWIGMGNLELLDYFQDYKAIKARHSYGPQGHRGMSVLIFEGTAVGYSEAERLHKHFEAEGTDREAWDRRRVLFYPGGQRQLYGFLATKEDLDTFNRHCQGKTNLKFDMRSHHEMVVIPLKQMSEDNQQLIWLKHKVAKEQRHSKALEESFGIVSEKLRQTMEENRIVRQRTKWQHEEYREEMDSQEAFYKDQMKVIHEARDARDDKFELEQQEKREKVKQLNAYPSINEDAKAREHKIQEFIKSQESEMEEFVAERDRLGKLIEARKVEMKKRHWEEEMELEKDYDAELSALMEKYTPKVDDNTA
ncbi:unnamed protein product [Rhodiola kirilowii]